MAKLFSLENDGYSKEIGRITNNGSDLVEISDEIQDSADSLNYITEALKTSSNQLLLVSDISISLNTQNRASASYFTSLENYTLFMDSVANNLGVKNRIPSLEDFKNPYGTEASHAIAMEGFFDYIKQIWKKIKEVFASFFKKINMFMRRLLKYDLDLETYEKYIEAKVAKIKAKKPTISNNKLEIDSKLPSLLAHPGMESVTSDFILTTGRDKFRQLARLMNNTFMQKLTEIGDKDLRKVYEVINKLVSIKVNEYSNLDEFVEVTDSIKEHSLSIMSKIFSHDNIRLNETPDTVFNDIQQFFTRDEINSSMTIRSLIDNNNSTETLPKNFNCYYINFDNIKTFITSSTEVNQFVKNKVTPISNPDNLIKFYEDYRKTKSEVNIRKLDDSSEVLDRSIDLILSVMNNKFAPLLESLQTIKFKKNRLNTKDALLKLMILLNPMKTSENRRIDIALLLSSKLNLDDNDITMKLISESKDQQEEAKQYFINNFKDQNEELFINAVSEILIKYEGKQPENVISDIDPKKIEEILKVLQNFQKFMVNYLTSMQNMIKQLSINLAGVFAELKFEIVKYIYNSCAAYDV